MSRWLDKPGYVVAFAVLAGAVAAAIIAIVLFVSRGDDNGGGNTVAATSTPAAETATPGTPAGGTPTAEVPDTLGVVTDPDDALITFVREQLQSTYVGDCPQALSPGEEVPQGICSQELYRSGELVTFLLGQPLSEGIGELVFTNNGDGTWTGDFVRAPPLAESAVVLDQNAVVMNAGDCLRFRSAPGTASEVLTCQIDGTRARVIEGPVDVGGQLWWRLEGLGWATGAYLVRAAE